MLWRDQRARFAALLKSDPRRSIAERWARLQTNRPEVAQADFEYMPTLLDHTWVVMAVPEDRVLYTVGLHYHYAQPELLLSSPGIASEMNDHAAALNEMGARVRDGERVKAGDVVECAGHSIRFNAYLDEHFDLYPCGIFGGFEELFRDVVHDEGGTVPILWAEVATKASREPKAPVKRKKPRTR